MSLSLQSNSEELTVKKLYQDLQMEIQKELKLAQAEAEEDEDLFLDEGSDNAGDWTEESAEEPMDQAAQPEDESSTEEELSAAEPAPPVAESQPVAKKPAPAKKVAPPVAKKETPKKTPPPAAKAKNKTSPKRVPASFKQGFKVTTSECALHSQPSHGSSTILNSKSGKKLWLEYQNETWYKGFHSKGVGYFPASCF